MVAKGDRHMPSPRAFGISIAAGLIVGSGGGHALDIIAIGALSGAAIVALVAAFLRRSAPRAEAGN